MSQFSLYMSFNIDSIAIIGGGPAGLTTLNELLNTAKNGTTTVHTDSRPADPAFQKIVIFEQKGKAGGNWATDINNADYVSDEAIKSKEYYKLDVIQPKLQEPAGTQNSDLENPTSTDPADNSTQWRTSAVYPGLFSNVPRRFLRFSTIKYKPEDFAKISLDPLIKYQEIEQLLTDFVEDKKLSNNIRLNTQVQNVRKDPSTNKWILTLRHTNTETGKDEWYSELFDAVVVSSGHYSVPYIPYVEGLETRDISTVLHSKSFRHANDFKDKNVLLVGTSLSGIDLVQYLNSVAKNLYVSRTPGKQEIAEWITKAANTLNQKPRIKKISNKSIEFIDGSVLDDIDILIFSTGYHWSYQYLSEGILNSTTEGYGNQATSSSRIKGLYYDTFSISDPTIGFVGINLTFAKFHTLETSGAALAGVWSNSKKLPSKGDQIKWEQDRLKATGDGIIFHYYPHNIIKPEWVDKIIEFAPTGRKNPLDNEDLKDFDRAFVKAEEVFYDLYNNKGNYNYLEE